MEVFKRNKGEIRKMNSAKYENIVILDILELERTGEEVQVFPSGKSLFFNVQCPFVAEEIEIKDVIKLQIANKYYFVKTSDFAKSIIC